MTEVESRRSVFARLVDRIAAADPAFARLRMACRSMLSLGLVIAGLVALSKVMTLSIAAYGMAVVTCFMAASAVRDPSGRGQLTTRAIAGVAAMVAFVVACLLSHSALLADIGFLTVIFLAVLARRYGPRWVAVGTIAFMSYYMGDYLQAKPADIGPVALGVLVALGMTQLVTVVLIADHREKDFRRALVTIHRRIELVLAADSTDQRAMIGHLARLRDTILTAEGFLPQGAAGALAAAGAPSDLAVALFELQLVTERWVGTRWSGGEDNRELIERARAKVKASVKPEAFVAPDAAPAPTAVLAAVDPPKWGVQSVLHAPIQVTLACIIALGLGYAVSPTRWTWAVMTAFVVFSNTKSRADTAVRAIERSAGTLAGLAGGVLLATLLRGDSRVAIAGILLTYALSFYFQSASYSLSLFLTTIALALLYGVMGMFTPAILVLRLEETVVGSVCAILAAFVVFPSHASTALGSALADYLAALDTFVRAANARAHGETVGDLVALSRALDRKHSALALLAKPIGGPWELVTRFGNVRGKLLMLAGCTHWARRLAQSGAAIDATKADALSGEILALTAKLDARKATWFEHHGKAAPPKALGSVDDPLEAIAALLTRAIAQ